MVDYSIDIKDEGVAYQKAVNMPSSSDTAIAVSGAVKLGDGVFKTLDALDRARKASAPTESAIKRGAFAKLSQAVNGTKGMAPLNKRIAINSALTEYQNSGFEIGQAETQLVKLAGIDIDYLNFDPQQAAIDSALDTISKNAGHMTLAKQQLDSTGKPYTQADLLRVAVKNVQQTEAAALYIANSQVVDQAEFESAFVPQAKVLMDNLEAQIMTGLAIEMQAGKNILPENVMELEVGLTQLRSFITSKIPSNLPEGVSKPLFGRLDILKTQLDNLKNYDQNILDANVANHIRQNTEALIAMLDKEVDNPLLENALLSGKFDATDLLGDEIVQLRKTFQGLQKKDMEYIDLFTYNAPIIPSETGGNGPEISVSNLDGSVNNLHDPEEIENVSELSNTARKDIIFFNSIESINHVKPKNMNLPEHRDNFLQGIGKVTVTISTSPEIFKEETLNQIFNEDMFKKLQIIELIDPDKATIARNRLGDALIQQLQLVNTATSGSAQGSFFKVTGLGEIEYDLEQRLDTGQIRMDKEVGDMVRMYANKRYNGNITAMIADRGRRLETLERSQIEDLGFKFQAAYADYRKVLKNSNKKKYYIKNLRRLGVLTGDLEQSLIKEVETPASSGQGTLENPWVIEWSGNRETDLKIMASIGSGQHYFDSAGGIRVKK
jgi:hypothetical protein